MYIYIYVYVCVYIYTVNIPHIATVSDTSSMPPNDAANYVGSYVSAYIHTHFLQKIPMMITMMNITTSLKGFVVSIWW